MENSAETIRLLVVTREIAALRALWSIVESNTWHAETVGSAWEAMDRLQSGVAPELLLLDLPPGNGDSLHILRWLRRLRPEIPIMLLCHAAEAARRQEAIRLGATEVLIRPFREEDLQSAILRLTRCSYAQLTPIASNEIEPLDGDECFVSGSPAMRNLREQLELLAQDDVPVLILGEKGTGKETTARLLHRLSVRSGFPFSKVNCAALPPDLLQNELFGEGSSTGKFAIAEKGTIFFAELTDLPIHLQEQLMNILQGRGYVGPRTDLASATDVRIVASTSASVERALAEKKLREDLYNRLSAFTVHVPPLRHRTQEIAVLLHHFMHRLAKHYGLREREFSPRVIEACKQYSWPRNVEQLKEFVKRYLIAGESRIVMKELEPASVGGVSHPDYVGSSVVPIDEQIHQRYGDTVSLKSLIQDIKSETEQNAIGLALEKTGWNRKEAARLLNVSYRTLLYKIEQYQLKPSASPGGAHIATVSHSSR